MTLSVLGMGTAVPATRVPQAEAAAVARAICCRDEEQAAWARDLYGQTEIRARHLAFDREVIDDVLAGRSTSGSVFLPSGEAGDRGPTTRQRMEHYQRMAGPLALLAASRALQESSLGPQEITHVVTVSCTGFSAPGVDVGLIKGLSLAGSVERTHVGFMGCHGALNGVRVARAFSGAQPEARVLVCAVELCSLHYYYRWDPKRLIANALFADGAAALVGAPPAAAPAGAWRAVATGSCWFPGTESAMTWDVGDHGFDMCLSTRIPGLIAGGLGGWLCAWLRSNGTAIDEVRSWAVHPGGPRILAAVAEALGLSDDDLAPSHAVYAECGNMSSPTVLFILDRLRRGGAPRPCVSLGFGPGLVAEAVLWR